jgi:hypothetical protein
MSLSPCRLAKAFYRPTSKSTVWLRLIFLCLVGLTLWTFFSMTSIAATTTTNKTMAPDASNTAPVSSTPDMKPASITNFTIHTTNTKPTTTTSRSEALQSHQHNGMENSTTSSSSSPSFPCQPTHRACHGYNGVYHIQSGDYGGASGTIFFQFVVAQLVYADLHNLLPFVYFTNYSHLIYDNRVHGGNGAGLTFDLLDGQRVGTLQDPRWHRALYPGPLELLEDTNPHHRRRRTYTVAGDGVWSHYFQPVSDYCPTDKSCLGEENNTTTMLPYITMEPAQISPGLHLYAPYAPKIWRYAPLPAFVAQPHIESVTEWLTPQRLRAHEVVKKYFHFQPWMKNQSQIVETTAPYCLGLHVRWSDKGASRRKLGLDEFFPFVKTYMEHYHLDSGEITSNNNNNSSSTSSSPCIYLATDAQQVVQYVTTHWPLSYQKVLITSRATIRSPNETAVFDMGSHHATNTEVLVDILDLSHCQFLLHGNSAVSEAAIYMNVNLIYQSVNLEDPHHSWTPQSFGTLVQNVTKGTIAAEYWKTTYRPPKEWWNVADEVASTMSKDASVSRARGLCLDHGEIAQHPGHNDILNITLDLWPTQTSFYPQWSLSVNKLTTRLFVDLTNQLHFAKLHILQPWLDDGFMMWSKWFELSNKTAASEGCGTKDRTIRQATMTNETSAVWPSMRFFQKKKSTSSTTTSTDGAFQSWFQGMRLTASNLLQATFRFRPFLIQQAEQVFSIPTDNPSRNRSHCLGLHIPDPGYKRNTKLKQWVRKSYPQAIYEAYVDAFRQAGGTCIYLATDSHSIWEEWTRGNTAAAIAMSADEAQKSGAAYFTQRNAVRNRENTPSHYMEESVNRLVSETLVDVWNLASCGILIHGSHPVSDAALFWNSNHLHSFHVQESKKEELSERLNELQALVLL